MTDEQMDALISDYCVVDPRDLSGINPVATEEAMKDFARALLARQPAAIEKQDEIARIRYGALRDAENIARLFDLGTPDGHAIADSIRKLAEAECAQPTAAPSVEQPISDAMMDLVDRLGSEAKNVDPRAWDHLLVYAPSVEQDERVEEEPRLVGYAECRCILSQYCDGTCRPLFEKARAAQSTSGGPK